MNSSTITAVSAAGSAIRSRSNTRGASSNSKIGARRDYHTYKYPGRVEKTAEERKELDRMAKSILEMVRQERMR